MELFLSGRLCVIGIMSWLPCLLLLLVILSFLYLLRVAQQRRRPSSVLPPGPPPLPLIGNLLSLGRHPHRDLARLAAVHGPIMTIKLGLNAAVVISSAEAAKQVLQEKDRQLSGRWVNDSLKCFRFDETSLLVQSPGKSWKQLKSICSTGIFSSKALDATRRLRQRKVRELVAYFRDHAGRPVKVINAMFGTTSNIVSNIAFSADVVDLNSESTQDFKNIISGIVEEAGKLNMSDFFGVLRVFDLEGRRSAMRLHLGRLFDMIDNIIDNRIKLKSSATSHCHGDFLDTLLQLHDESKLDRTTIRSLISDLFIAGSEAATIALEWAMTELLRNPTVLARAQNELDNVIGSTKEEIEESDIDDLPYLHAVVKEVLRLHPPAPLIPHRAMEDGVELDGYTLPKNTQVLINVWAIGRDERFWPEPNAFNPDRFLGKVVSYRGRDFELLPFSSGRRICAGIPLAERMLHLMLASLLHAFDWGLPEGISPEDMKMEENFGLSVSMAAPLQAVAFPITRAHSAKP